MFVDNVNLMNVVHNRSAEQTNERDHGRATDIQQGALDNICRCRVGTPPFFVVGDIVGSPGAVLVEHVYTRCREGSRRHANKVPETYHPCINNWLENELKLESKSDTFSINHHSRAYPMGMPSQSRCHVERLPPILAEVAARIRIWLVVGVLVLRLLFTSGLREAHGTHIAKM